MVRAMDLLRRFRRKPEAPARPAKQPKPPLPETRILGLDERQLFPKGEGLSPDFFVEESHRLLTRETPVASIGSCFAQAYQDYFSSKS